MNEDPKYILQVYEVIGQEPPEPPKPPWAPRPGQVALITVAAIVLPIALGFFLYYSGSCTGSSGSRGGRLYTYQDPDPDTRGNRDERAAEQWARERMGGGRATANKAQARGFLGRGCRLFFVRAFSRGTTGPTRTFLVAVRDGQAIAGAPFERGEAEVRRLAYAALDEEEAGQ